MNAFVGWIAAGGLILGLRQQRHVFRDHPGFKPGIGIGGGALGGVGHFDVGLRAAGVGRRVGKGVTHAAAVAAPVRGIADAHQNLVERDHRGEFRLRQDRRQVLGDERDLGIGFGGVGVVRIVGGGGSGGADIGQHALGVERRDLGAEIAGRHRQIAGDADERPHPHHVAVADAGDGRNPHHIPRGGRFAGRRQTVALVQAALLSLAPNAPRSAPSTRSGTLAKVISPSSDAKTAPPMRAAPHRPVRMVPLNHCTETRRRSITAASEPSTESGGS